MMEPTIKIEEDSTDFDQFAFYSEHNVMHDLAKPDKKSAPAGRRNRRRLDLSELFQLSGAASSQCPLEKPFPIGTVNELNEFDNMLLGNPAYMEKCAHLLHAAVREEGNSLDNTTCHMRLLIEHAVDYAVILRYSWYGFLPRSPAARGAGEQHPFRNLIGVINLLHRTRQLRFAACTGEEIHEGIEKFLKRKLRCHALYVKKQQFLVRR